jgi:hypothetical protein
MANTRGSDERLAYKHSLAASAGPGAYLLGTPHACASRFVDDPRVSSQGNLASVCGDVPLVDVDSELMGITRKLGSCPESKFRPDGDKFCNLAHAVVASEAPFETEDCRLSNPACTLRGTGWNRWQWLCQDPQTRAMEPFERVVNYRTIVKDTHRPLIETPLEETAAPNAPTSSPSQNVLDLQSARSIFDIFPAHPPGQHWRELRDIKRISGDCECGHASLHR